MVLPTNLTDCGQGLLMCTARFGNTATDGLFWLFALIGFVFVLFMASQRWGTARAYGFASLIGALLSWLFVSIGLLDWYMASIFILAGVVGIGVLILNKT